MVLSNPTCIRSSSALLELMSNNNPNNSNINIRSILEQGLCIINSSAVFQTSSIPNK